MPPIPGLAFAELTHGNDPGEVPSGEHLRSRATKLGDFVTNPEHRKQFGLLAPDREKGIEPPIIESIRTLRRIATDNTVAFEQVAEIVQRRRTGKRKWFYGGATVIIDARGAVRYSIVKNVNSKRRELRLTSTSPHGPHCTHACSRSSRRRR
jgi:hypothetical protein